MPGFPATPPGFQGTVLVPLSTDHPEFLAVADELQATIVKHKDSGISGGIFDHYVVIKVQKIFNRRLWERYVSVFSSTKLRIYYAYSVLMPILWQSTIVESN